MMYGRRQDFYDEGFAEPVEAAASGAAFDDDEFREDVRVRVVVRCKPNYLIWKRKK
jgi:hypothetical protein